MEKDGVKFYALVKIIPSLPSPEQIFHTEDVNAPYLPPYYASFAIQLV